jgi:hypothetical protein
MSDQAPKFIGPEGNAVIEWGDGSTSVITTSNDADLAHEYADAGDHLVRISGAFPNIQYLLDPDSDYCSGADKQNPGLRD